MASDRPALWPPLVTLIAAFAILILIVALRGSFFALAILGLAPVIVVATWFLMRRTWLRRQIDALPRYLTSRRVHVLLAEINEMHALSTRVAEEWGWSWSKEPEHDAALSHLVPYIGQARADRTWHLRTRRPETIPKERLQDTIRLHTDLRRHFMLSVAQELERREDNQRRIFAMLRERGLSTYDPGPTPSREVNWLTVTSRVKRLRDDQGLVVQEALAVLRLNPRDTGPVITELEGHLRNGTFSSALERLQRLPPLPGMPAQPRPVAPPAAPPPPPAATPPAPPAGAVPRKPRKKGEAL